MWYPLCLLRYIIVIFSLLFNDTDDFLTMFSYILSSIKARYAKSGARSKKIVKNVLLSLSMKVAGIISSFLVIPLTITYVNPTQYGIWLTLYSVILWVYFFDMGLSHGFRNKFVEARAEGNETLAKQYVSTTYFTILGVMGFVYILGIVANKFINWTSVLNIDVTYREELHNVFAIVFTFACLNMVFSIFSTLLTANQEPGLSSIIQAIGQYLSLGILYILTLCTQGSLTNLALYFAGVPCMTLGICSLLMFFFTKYRCYRPNILSFKFSLVKNILGLGIQFFCIQICMLIIFQIVNIVISRELGSLAVTQFNVAEKYFNIIYMLVNIIMIPFWSAFTDAYTKRDLIWMKSATDKLQKCWYVAIGIGVIMLTISPFVYKFWIGGKVEISFFLSCAMFWLIVCRTFGAIYMQLINGTGHVRVQLIVYIVSAAIAWPLYTISSRLFGLIGIVVIPACVYFVQGFIGRIQISKIINNTAKGVWIK